MIYWNQRIGPVIIGNRKGLTIEDNAKDKNNLFFRHFVVSEIFLIAVYVLIRLSCNKSDCLFML